MKAEIKRNKNSPGVTHLSGVNHKSPGKVSKKKHRHPGFSSDQVSKIKLVTQSDSDEKPKKKKKSKIKKNKEGLKETARHSESMSEEEMLSENSDPTGGEEMSSTEDVKSSGVLESNSGKKEGFGKFVDGSEDERTIFVGNVGLNIGKRKFASFFSKYGKVEAIRLRSAAPAQPEVSKKEAVIKRNVHPSRSTINAYVRFKTTEMMEAALEANGALFEGTHIWVDRASQPKTHDRHCAVFVGNLPFECEEENLYKHFEECGEIDNVRIIRDKKFSSGKGFGYINFKSSDAVEVALQLDGKQFMKRNLRIQRCVKKVKKFQKKGQLLPQDGQSLGFMKVKGSSRMSLKFMKNKEKERKGRRGKGQKNNAQNKNQGKFSGQKMIQSSQFKKMQKSKKKPSKEEKRKHFVSHFLTGSKPMKK
ncbi:RNA-binding protein 34-like [Macrobrachium nipponense]|uniref:RNA-binding protein 34-like n=1 Tax=Macrobrachium nipponense TaxID=159736 RepID=UPI0030C8C810